jgi:hypothetical protein
MRSYVSPKRMTKGRRLRPALPPCASDSDRSASKTIAIHGRVTVLQDLKYRWRREVNATIGQSRKKEDNAAKQSTVKMTPVLMHEKAKVFPQDERR